MPSSREAAAFSFDLLDAGVQEAARGVGADVAALEKWAVPASEKGYAPVIAAALQDLGIWRAST
jgi:hypothetical protein